MGNIEAVLETCARAIYVLLDNGDITSDEFLAYIHNMNAGTFGPKEKIPGSKEEIQQILKNYIKNIEIKQTTRFINTNDECDACGCTPCDCHWGTM